MVKIRSNERLNFTPKEENRLIDYVKKHPVLYDTKNSLFRNAKHKSKLWEEIASILSKNANHCSKKWKYIRDYYVKLQQRTIIINSTTPSTLKRNEKLKFLDDLIENRNTVNIFTNSIKNEDIEDNDEYDKVSTSRICSSVYNDDVDNFSSTLNDETLNDEASSQKSTVNISVQPSCTQQTYSSQQLITNQERNNSVDQFFASMCTTVKSFSAVMQVHAKMKISQMICEMELDYIEKQSSSLGLVHTSSVTDY